jgi:hypothetical protein
MRSHALGRRTSPLRGLPGRSGPGAETGAGVLGEPIGLDCAAVLFPRAEKILNPV